MHIVFTTPAFPPFRGGGERYAADLARSLARRGHRVTVVTSAARAEADLWQGRAAPDSAFAPPTGVAVVGCGLRPFPGGRGGLLAWRKAMVLLSTLPGDQTTPLQYMARRIPPIEHLDAALDSLPQPADVVHGFNISWEHALLAGWKYARRRGVPFVATPFAHLGSDGRDRVARNSTMDHQIHLLRAADRVLTLTGVERDGLARLNVPAQRLAVIGGGLDVDPTLLASAAASPPVLPRPYALFIGRVSFEKGAIHAAEAVLALNRQGTAVHLALVGQAAPEFERFYARLSPEERRVIRPLGSVTEAEKHALLAHAALLALPSRTDSFGIVLLEAWAHARPVIGARAGGIPGVIDAGENGLLVEFGAVEALAGTMGRLLDDADLRERLGRNGRAKLQREYTWDRVAARVLDHYIDLLA